jgi:hypothetical protein
VRENQTLGLATGGRMRGEQPTNNDPRRAIIAGIQSEIPGFPVWSVHPAAVHGKGRQQKVSAWGTLMIFWTTTTQKPQKSESGIFELVVFFWQLVSV